MKKLIQIECLILLSVICIIAAIPVPEVESFEEPLKWEKTVKIKPNPVILLQLVVRETPNWDKGCTDTTIQLSQSDAWLLMSVASAEALDQGESGMLRVMTVIMNRVYSDEFPNTVYEVISQQNQFESFTNGSYLTAEITPECHMALATLEKNKNLDHEIFAFETISNGNILTKWFDFAFTYKDHNFYKLKKD